VSALPRPVYFVLHPQFLLLDLAGVAEAFRYANEFAARGTTRPFALHYVAPTSDAEVHSSVGVAVVRTGPMPEQLEDDAIVIIVGARSNPNFDRIKTQRDIVDWLQQKVRPEHWVLCICSGALLAARAGLLDGRECTTHHELCEELSRIRPAVRVQLNRIFVRSGNVFTSAGITAGIDLALHVLGDLLGPRVALDIARMMVVYLRREAEDPQLSPWLAYRNHLHPLVHQVQDAVTGNPQRDWTLPALGRLVHLSPRQLTRLFQLHSGISPAAYVMKLRGARAEELLKSTDMPVERVGEKAGFGSARQFRRAMRAQTGDAPSRVRRKARRDASLSR
jgi:transcriptional regulator GlxA family with amidase domain